MTNPDGLTSTAKLYEDRGDVPLSVPMLQGDVFAEVEVPGLSDDPICVMVAAHPCSMRRGADLAERIAVAPVNKTAKITDSTWAGYGNFMLLPDLKEDGSDYSADFRSITSTPSKNIPLEKRIAALSSHGQIVLQQRTIKFWTRFHVPYDDLSVQAAPIFTEAELQRDWVEAALEANEAGDEMSVVLGAVREFHAWLDENKGERRVKLSSIPDLAQLRRDARREAASRYS